MKGGGKKSYVRYTAPLSEGGPLYGDAKKQYDCASLNFDTILQNIQRPFDTVKIGDNLPVVLKGKVIEVTNSVSEVYGNIISPHNGKLIDCIGKGHKFRAVVVSVKGDIHIEADI